MVNVGTELDRACDHDASRTALVAAGSELTLSRGQLLGRVRRMTEVLRGQGVRPGDRVALLAGNTFNHVTAWYAALRAGAIVVDVNYLLGAASQQALLADADPTVVVAEPGLLAEGVTPDRAVVMAADAWTRTTREAVPAERTVEDPAVIAYTSGTTGTPKGVVHTHGAVAAQLELLRVTCGYDATWTSYVAIPLFSLHGYLPQVAAALRVGARVVLDDKFTAERFAAMTRRYAIHYTTLSSPMLPALLALPPGEAPDLSHIRVMTCGGAPLHPDVRTAFESRYGLHLTQGYACTEVLGAFVMDLDGEAPPGAAGRLYPRDRDLVRVVDDVGGAVPPGTPGEILFDRSVTMQGYWNRPDETEAAFVDGRWYATGDVGHLDEDGFLTLLDRKKDVIFRGGFNIFSAEVERSLAHHPAIHEATVVAGPHARLGEVPVAYVVLRDGQTTTPDALRAHVRERLGRLHEPDVVHLVDRGDLPRNSLGKVQKSELRVRLRAEDGS